MKRSLTAAAMAVLGLLPLDPSPASAQAYPIDCAILLCLSGGWPASAPCARAKAEFIRRITPWPIEPPLQVWRCPMSIDFVPVERRAPPGGLVEVTFDLHRGALRLPGEKAARMSEPTLHSAQAIGPGADIDLAGAAFDFVRSILVWDVRNYSHRRTGRDDCQERFSIKLGTYDAQGRFRWDQSVPAATPEWLIPSRECSNANTVRAVGVEWRDQEGRHGHEVVRY